MKSENWVADNDVSIDPNDTPARRKFQLHDEVRLSESAIRQELGGREPWKAWITSFPRDGNKVSVHRKGFKVDQTWHIDLLERVKGESNG